MKPQLYKNVIVTSAEQEQEKRYRRIYTGNIQVKKEVHTLGKIRDSNP